MLLDIHTHHVAAVPRESILNVEPLRFASLVRGGKDREKPLAAPHGYYSVGIHPWKVPEVEQAEWECLKEAVKHPAVLAIGEAGLDKLALGDMALQKDVFVRQILLSESVGKPLIIHCVKAFNELIELKKKYRPRMPWIVHGFRNNLNIARQLLREGIYFSLGEKYQAEVLREVPLERLLAETDESAIDIRTIIGRMAGEKGVETVYLCDRVDENARKIFFQP